MSDNAKFSAHIVVVLLICFFSTAVFAMASSHSKRMQAALNDYENLIYLKTTKGVVAIELMPNVAPHHVARIKELVASGFYDGVPFHRVIDGFVAQTGDPTGTGTGGSGKTLKAEFSNLRHERGVVSMARAQDVNSADSQFFIVLKDSPFLDRKYTVWGRVVSGMEYVDKIKKGDPSKNGKVMNPDKILSAVLASHYHASQK